MDAVGAIRAAITQCGQPITTTHEGVAYRFTACVMPRAYGTANIARQEESRFGMLDGRTFSYYGPLTGGGEWICEGESFCAGDKQYRVVACHDFYYRAQAVFRHAIATLDTEDAM